METQPPPQTECLCKQFHMVELTVKPALIQDLGCPPSKEAQLLFFFFFFLMYLFAFIKWVSVLICQLLDREMKSFFA